MAMLADNALIGWLCMMRLQWEHQRTCQLPNGVSSALAKRGWITVTPEVDWEGDHTATITAAGDAIIDINGAEWGLDTIPEEAGS